MSRFEPTSDIGRVHELPVGQSLHIDSRTADVLQASAWLQGESGVCSTRPGPNPWRCTGLQLTKLHERVQFDLGGIAKGYAVDCAVAAVHAAGCAAGWVKAGGDLRAFGNLELPITLRDEQHGGVRPFGLLSDGAFATSHGSHTAKRQVSVMAPLCLWADALTKVVARSARADHPLLAQLGASAWLH